ncbi:transcriptional repressor [Prochlorococcus sp. MIT 1223]|uniref:Fur family transcriptional regulator n=1 Tax=Prochlorococcus sp. MIT 1223 TaxID=3096217 RepID=UPI002A74C195|nr:transcriptional repressor [Prochlorococcus sp. MIT 1223]
MVKSNPNISNRQNQILEKLGNCDDELSGQELYRVLHAGESSMGLATVYRNLQVLVKKGLVRSRNLPTGEVLYAPVKRDVHHLTCVDCGITTSLQGCPVKNINLPQSKTKNFQLLFHTLEFFGLCQHCLERQST